MDFTAPIIFNALVTFAHECGNDILKDKAISRYKKVTKKFVETFKDLDMPTNFHVQKSAIAAQWLTTKYFVQQLQGIHTNRGANFSETLIAIEKQANEVLDLLEKNEYLPTNSLLDNDEIIELIANDHSDTNQNEELRLYLANNHLNEIKQRIPIGSYKNRPSFEELQKYIINNKELIVAGSNKNRILWYQLVCAYFNQLLKGDNNFAKDGYQNHILAKISLQNVELKHTISEILEKFEKVFIPNYIGDDIYTNIKNDLHNQYILLNESLQEIKTSISSIREGLLENNSIKKFEKRNLGFSVKRGSEIEPFDLLKRRANPSQGYNESFYMHREIDNELYKQIESKKNIILTGKPLSGKSRAVLELIRNHYSKSIIIIIDGTQSVTYSDIKDELNYINLDIKEQIGHIIIIFNDCEDTFSEYVYKNLIQFALNDLKSNINIIISYSSHRYFELFNNLGERLIQYFETIRIHDLDTFQKNSLKKRLKIENDKYLGERIGSYFVPIDSIRHLYESDQLSTLSKSILRSYKVLGCWKQNKRNYIDNIRIHTEKFLSPKIIADSEWNESLIQLIQCGFISLADSIGFKPQRIIIDSSYEEIIGHRAGENLLPETMQVDEILRYYTPTQELYNKLIERVKSDKISWYIFQRMYSEGLKSNFFTFQALHTRIREKDKNAQKNNIKKELNKADQATQLNYKLYSNKNEYETKIDFIKQISINSPTDSITFYACSRDAKTFKEAFTYYQILLKGKCSEADIIYWNYTLLELFSTLPLGDISFETLIKNFYELIKSFLSEIAIEFWWRFFKQFFKVASSFQEASIVYNEMILADRYITTAQFVAYLRRAKSLGDSLIVKEQAENWCSQNGEELTNNFYNFLIANPNLKEFYQINSIYTCLSEPDDYTYAMIFRKKSLTNDQMWDYFMKYTEAKDYDELSDRVPLLSWHFLPLFLRDFNDEKIELIFKKTLELDIIPSYLLLHEKSGAFTIPDSRLDKFIEIFLEVTSQNNRLTNKLYPAFYTKILSRNLSLSVSIKLYKHAMNSGFMPRSPAINKVIEKSQSFKEIEDIRKIIPIEDISVNINFIQLILNICNDINEFIGAVEWINTLNIHFQIDMLSKSKYSTMVCKKFLELTSFKISNQDCIKTFKNLLNLGITPTHQVYNILLGRTISKSDLQNINVMLDLMKDYGYSTTIESIIGIQKLIINIVKDENNSFNQITKELEVIYNKIPFILTNTDNEFAFVLPLYSNMVQRVTSFEEAKILFSLIRRDGIRYTAWSIKYIINPLDKFVSTQDHRNTFNEFVSFLRYK
ncbi:hypothetical protein ACS5NO_28190 [Larkinella sp. GY13]|uniref:hypothetical protein n=1 Tax=Larkinella sp. GY13 TaxID=3453720 RepID=UPI003EECEE0D